MSSLRRTDTDIGGNASSIAPSKVSIAAIVERCPPGSTTTSSPVRMIPPATCPA